MSEEEDLKKGMEAKAKEFVEKGSEVYAKVLGPPNDSPVLDFLKGLFHTPQDTSDGDTYEYRLLLSGCAYNGDLQGDYTKSTLGGLLLDEPFALWKVGHSYDEYPQELALWIRVAPVTKKVGNHQSTAAPHEAIANDIAAILTLFLRRLVVVVDAVSVTLPAHYSKPPVKSPWPLPVTLKARDSYFWPRLPLTVIYGVEQTYRNPNVEDVPVSPMALGDFFRCLAKHKHGDRIISAARLYHRAMEGLFRQTEISYLLLVCAAETVAAVETQTRTEEEQLEAAQAKQVRKHASDLGLSDDDARKLALAAVAAFDFDKKSKRQMFREFLLKFGADHQKIATLFNPDVLDLFKVPDEKAAIDEAYSARGGYVHAAKPFKEGALAGTSSNVPAAAAFDVLVDVLVGKERKIAPPIIWFERLVAHSIKRYIKLAG